MTKVAEKSKSSLFADKGAGKTREATEDSGSPWKILIVDDEPEVHSLTEMVLRKVRFKERSVRLLNAHSSIEAKEVMERERDIAIILLDVVMETDDAGLMLVRHIRETLGNNAVRIILRTGQPGQAPEERVIVDYDINDYKAKTELTSQKLFTATIAALRAYDDIIALEKNRRGLEKILDSSDSLFTAKSLKVFATGVLTQLSAFIQGGPDGILCIQKSKNGILVLAGAGEYEDAADKPLTEVGAGNGVTDAINRTLEGKKNIYGKTYSSLYIPVFDGEETVAFIHSPREVLEIDRKLLEVFASKISVGFANVQLYEDLERRVVERTRELKEAHDRLEHLAMVDPLTNAHNRRYFIEASEKEIARTRRNSFPLSTLLVDIDHFKKVNDTYGHAAGDEALKAFIPVAMEVLRESDLLGRVGGEEFAVLLPETDKETATKVAERLRAAAEKIKITAEGQTFGYTLSIGVAELDKEDRDIDKLLCRADKALYQAKKDGRNRVV